MPFLTGSLKGGSSSSKHVVYTGRGGAGNVAYRPTPPSTAAALKNTVAAQRALHTVPAEPQRRSMSSQSSESLPGHESDGSTRSSKRESTDRASNPSSRVSPTSTASRTFGRGGAGNSYPAWQRALFSFDEELDKPGAESAAPVFHIGRGGSGNKYRK